MVKGTKLKFIDFVLVSLLLILKIGKDIYDENKVPVM